MDAINNYLKPHFKIGIDLPDIYRETIAISRIIQKDKVIIILFLPKISRSQDPKEIDGGWNRAINRIYEMLSDIEFKKLKMILEKIDVEDVNKLKAFLSEFQADDIPKVKAILDQYNNDDGTYSKKIDNNPKLEKVLDNFEDDGQLKNNIKFKNPVLDILSRVTVENIQEVLTQVTESFGLNSAEFEAVQFTSIPAFNVVATIIVVTVYHQKFPMKLFKKNSSSNDIEMGSIDVQKLREDFENMKAELKQLKEDIIKEKTSKILGARSDEPDN